MELEKQMFDKQLFAGPCRDSGTQRHKQTSLGSSCLHTQFLLEFSMLTALLLEQILYLQYSFMQLGGRSEVLPESSRI